MTSPAYAEREPALHFDICRAGRDTEWFVWLPACWQSQDQTGSDLTDLYRVMDSLPASNVLEASIIRDLRVVPYSYPYEFGNADASIDRESPHEH